MSASIFRQTSSLILMSGEREARLEAVTNDPLLPGRFLPSDYPGQQAEFGARRSRRFNARRRASFEL